MGQNFDDVDWSYMSDEEHGHANELLKREIEESNAERAALLLIEDRNPAQEESLNVLNETIDACEKELNAINAARRREPDWN